MNESKRNVAPVSDTSIGQDILALLGYWLRGRRGLIALGVGAAATGLWFGWSSLVAAGIAPLLLGVLPCVAMCALGLCMRRGGGESSRPDRNSSIGDRSERLEAADESTEAAVVPTTADPPLTPLDRPDSGIEQERSHE